MPNPPFFSLALPLNIYTPEALALILIRPCLLSPRLFDTHALPSNTAQKAAALRLHPACDHPRCLPTWYLPRESSHLPSLSQICLRSKEMHCTFESSKETSYTLPAGCPQIHWGDNGGARWSSLEEVGVEILGWQVMTRTLLNPWEILWTLLPPPSNVSVVGAMASQSG